MSMLAVWALSGLSAAQSSYSNSSGFNLQPFTISLSSEVPRMLNLVNSIQLPDDPEYPGVSAGMPLDSLKSLQAEWLTQFDWDKEQLAMNA